MGSSKPGYCKQKQSSYNRRAGKGDQGRIDFEVWDPEKYRDNGHGSDNNSTYPKCGYLVHQNSLTLILHIILLGYCQKLELVWQFFLKSSLGWHFPSTIHQF